MIVGMKKTKSVVWLVEPVRIFKNTQGQSGDLKSTVAADFTASVKKLTQR